MRTICAAPPRRRRPYSSRAAMNRSGQQPKQPKHKTEMDFYLTISVSCSSSRRCRIRTDSIILRSSSVRCERSGMGDWGTTALLLLLLVAAGDGTALNELPPKAAMSQARRPPPFSSSSAAGRQRSFRSDLLYSFAAAALLLLWTRSR